MKDIPLYNHITTILSSAGFKIEEDKWVRTRERSQGKIQVDVNGQTKEIPGQSILLRETFEIVGEGNVDSREFAEIRYTSEQANKSDSPCWTENNRYPDECIYFDTPEMFDWVFLS